MKEIVISSSSKYVSVVDLDGDEIIIWDSNNDPWMLKETDHGYIWISIFNNSVGDTYSSIKVAMEETMEESAGDFYAFYDNLEFATWLKDKAYNM